MAVLSDLSEPEVGALADRLAATRIVTLTGPGGVGKTYLADRVTDAVGLPVHRVDLSACRDAALVPYAVADALHASPEPGADPVHAVLELLTRSQGLLVLDTCEHVLTGCAYLVGRLYDTCPELQILATSRKPLDVPGEQLTAVSPLPPERTAELLQESAAAHDVELPDYWSRLLASPARRRSAVHPARRPHTATDPRTAAVRHALRPRRAPHRPHRRPQGTRQAPQLAARRRVEPRPVLQGGTAAVGRTVRVHR